MTKKEYAITRDYLFRLMNLNKELNDLLERRDYVLNKAISPSIKYSSDRVQTSGASDVVGNSVTEARYLSEEADRLTDEYVDTKAVLLDEIKQIRKEKYQDVLREKFVDDMKNGAIADKHDLTYRTCTNWIKTGIEEFFEVHKHKILYGS